MEMLIHNQLSLPECKSYLATCGRRGIGGLGEINAARLLEESGYTVSHVHPGEKRGDLRAVSPDGEAFAVEVKTARRGKDGKWRFTLQKTGCTNHQHSDFVVLLAVLKNGECVPFIIPTAHIRDRRHIVITSHPSAYGGRWSAYRTSTPLRLENSNENWEHMFRL